MKLPFVLCRSMLRNGIKYLWANNNSFKSNFNKILMERLDAFAIDALKYVIVRIYLWYWGFRLHN